MTKLIELNDDNKEVCMPSEVTHLVPVSVEVGDPAPNYYFDTMIDRWCENDFDDDVTASDLNVQFARAATPAEIASQAQPSEVVVSRELLEECLTLSHLGWSKGISGSNYDSAGESRTQSEIDIIETKVREILAGGAKLNAALSGKAVRE